jgi:hypothetical protein
MLLAARHNIPVHIVDAGVGLEKHEGVVALLTRAEPSEAATDSPLGATDGSVNEVRA